ncbi:hypothetical protein LTR56_000094 [Elasticomyces elasticus]|nr:hypothetical protein LTR56_000094 [Elasticomyces elasticus]KAK3667082.1 hypothetical protein LTR22_001946 [Elasticomyces elasticus]KAK4932857.1 hypothetical protein LTR49_000813 [Elasticomyces elasticus]KAK5768739.1 hypothetical protein LTS12_001165 [Elasticomyces elasticus]
MGLRPFGPLRRVATYDRLLASSTSFEPNREPSNDTLSLEDIVDVHILFERRKTKMLLSPSELQKSAELHPQILDFIQTHPSPKADWSGAPAVKNLMAAVEANSLAQLGPPESTLQEFVQLIPM